MRVGQQPWSVTLAANDSYSGGLRQPLSRLGGFVGVERVEMNLFLSGKSVSRHGPGIASLGLQHLSRSQLCLLLSTVGLDHSGDKSQLVERFSKHLLSTLPWDWHVVTLRSGCGLEGPQREYAAVALWGEYVYLVGGGYASLCPEPELLWRYDLIKREWDVVDCPRAPCVRSGHTVCMYEDKLWLFGGYSDSLGQYFGDMVTFDLNTHVWELVEQKGLEMESRAWHSVTVVGTSMLLYGDNGDCDQSKDSPGVVYAFDFKTTTWEEILTSGEPPSADDVQEITVHGNTLWVFCLSSTDSNNSMAIYTLDLTRKAWSLVEARGQIPCGRIGCTATVLDDKWIVHGGFPRVLRHPQNWDIVGDTYEFDFKTREWSVINLRMGNLLPRGGHVALAWHNTVILMGGTTPSGATSEQNTGYGVGSYCTQVEMLWRCPLAPEENACTTKVFNMDHLHGIPDLYDDQDTCDVVLCSRGCQVRAHKVVLAASSKAFRRMFSVEMIENQDGKVDMDTISPIVLASMVQYLYGRLESIPSHIVVDLFRVADLYGIEGLRDECLMRMKGGITVENVAMMVKAADEHSCKELEAGCVDFAASNGRLLEVIKSDAYLDMLRQAPELGQRFTHQAACLAVKNATHPPSQTPDSSSSRDDYRGSFFPSPGGGIP
ncbi:hypothetical protein BSKO_05134 [Bryopsis sp. KO-2023]|nr:hypothetical protein BSKO_05134 [Bryopsis sp. KO-2023]